MAAVPPDAVTQRAALRSAVADTIAPQTQTNLLIGTWNLRAFSGLSPTWQAGAGDSPKRDWRAVTFIAEVIRRCDVVALQEIRRDPTALRFLLKTLGPQWRVIVSDVTEGEAGNGERLAFVYNTERVQPSGLVGELVLPAVSDQPVRQFARSPYAASFQRGDTEFILPLTPPLWRELGGAVDHGGPRPWDCAA
ncbi:hypothetical protein BKG80_06665 [Mycobacteroides chelonae]|jgi:hypothetical protein|uniref:hypothetical protein n=1 Tax=Mycobacteroides TaxID=670516 RepID=UPI00071334A7|nr:MULTISPECIES: hypothetical protein [Mycobacteroides]KRQ28147.1 hypothetical protein AOT86_09690 [Mycobacteroides sp. H072]KRQ34091.1 hypothetical protein AOT84_19365 [Mycobacteroides sp. H002]KRQ53750.1 hypothetical protein AOT85_06795 [Mycobacteroides sp. H054]KRQ66648.1 hypothetical protein AOT83_22270 [Mycobacteroides sp. H001]MBF9350292.1 hypothetical protein [Mycobacteroides chelonae]